MSFSTYLDNYPLEWTQHPCACRQAEGSKIHWKQLILEWCTLPVENSTCSGTPRNFKVMSIWCILESDRIGFKKQSFCLDSGFSNSKYIEQHTYILYERCHYVSPVQHIYLGPNRYYWAITAKKQIQIQTNFHLVQHNKNKAVLCTKKSNQIRSKGLQVPAVAKEQKRPSHSWAIARYR